ncbi:maleylacetoacetate isomerase [Sneathiella sp. P13V-1]|uniref:maleylacetoacetate isomerase n=1 Tax=Sneathiella sp. P13V-1 TaxID=2697366 RepID=UPI00187B2527|nr:maleylacetoacetate isomerase [Sneathiella sp. P13V-1]MBE7637829.1 maleylacetoacetate isomerase [Sneathiella sp. P13V-1]
MELFTYFRSSAAYRVRIALNLKEIPHKLTTVNLLKAEHKSDAYLKLNPQGLVPSLKLDDGRVINQSTAMLEYLEATSDSYPLLPSNPYDAATVREWCNIIGNDIHPVDNLRILKYLTGTLGVSEDEKMTWYHHWIHEGFKALESQVKATPYCFGNQITLADLYLVPQVYNALRFDLDMANYPKIRSIYDACNKLEAFINAAPENQPQE